MRTTDGHAMKDSKMAAEVISLLCLEQKACYLRYCQNLSLQDVSRSLAISPKSVLKLLETASHRLAREEELIK